MSATHTMRNWARNLLSLAVATACSLPLTAIAQDADDEAIEEILVTAQYREQAVTDVPISMAVMTGEMLENAGINELRNINRLAPDFFAVEDQNITRVSLRGIATLDNGESVDQALTINIDGEYVNRSRILNTTMFDLERVEILRGPQGTLYGRNSTAGAINLYVRRPDLDGFGGYVNVDAGNYNSLNITGAVNVPLGETMALRLAATSNEHDGYNDHPNFSEASGEQDSTAGRVGLLIQPSDELSINLTAERSKVDTTSNTFAFVDFNTPEYTADSAGNGTCSTPGWDTYAAVNAGFACVPQSTNNKADINPDLYVGPITGTLGRFYSEQEAYRLEINYDFGPAQLTYRGGHRVSDVRNDDALPDFIFFRAEDFSTTSHELRLSGESDGGVFWQTGMFTWEEDLYGRGGLYSPFINIPPVGNNGAWINTFYRPVVSESKAFFGQVEIPFADAFTAVLGLRYTSDEKTAEYRNFAFGFNFADPVGLDALRPPEDAPQVIPLHYKRGEPTWTVGLNYEPNDDTLIYGKISAGYKAGGFDSVGTFEPETVTAYEFGTKNTFDRFSLSGSVFHYDYSDLQASVLIDTTQGGQVFNAAQVTISGLEASGDIWLTENGRLSATLNYLNSEYDEFIASIPVQCVNCAPDDFNALPGNVDGNTPPWAPEWIFTVGYDHMFELSGGASITAGVFSRYKSDYYNTIYNYADGQQDAFTQTDVNVEYVSADGHWSVMAFARNIEDERPITYASFVSAGPADEFIFSFGPPMTYGIKVGYEF